MHDDNNYMKYSEAALAGILSHPFALHESERRVYTVGR